MFYILIVLFTTLPAFLRAESFLEYAGSLDIPHNTYVGGTKVGGLSGITYDASRDAYYAISDSPNFGRQRFYTLKITFEGATPKQLKVTGVTRLKDSTGHTFSNADTEGIAFYGSSSVWISSEGTEQRSLKDPHPWIRRFSLGGKQLEECELPAEFKFMAAPDDPNKAVRGVFTNQSLESLALSPDQKYLYTANELGLIQDRVEDVMLVRIVQFSQKKGEWSPNASKAYRISTGGFFHSLSDLSCVNTSGKLLALERYVNGFSLEPENFGFSIYEVDFKEKAATSVLGIDALQRDKTQPLTKTLLFNSEQAGLKAPDNVEGMCLGPVIQGRQTLVLVSDDNFQMRQMTRIHILLFPKK